MHNFPVQCTEKDAFIRDKLKCTSLVLKDPRGSKTAKYLMQVIYFHTVNYKPCHSAFQVPEMIQITKKFFLPDSIMSANNLLLPTNGKERPAYTPTLLTCYYCVTSGRQLFVQDSP